MATPTPVFPAAVATDAQLKVANNLIQTALTVAMASGDMLLWVNSTAGFVPNCLVSVDSEIIAVSSLQTSPAPALVVATGGRGFDGTTAAAHSSGAKVSLYIDAWHHNVLATEIKAIEGFIGPNGQNIGTGYPFLVAASFNFAAQSPGGTLAPGSNVITLTPVPKGVNGSDTGHYLYISSGTGTPEAVLITGGTAVSGQPSGTVIVTCANAHSGAWTIASATGGIQEAVNTATSGAAIIVNANITLYQSVVSNGQHLTVWKFPGVAINNPNSFNIFGNHNAWGVTANDERITTDCFSIATDCAIPNTIFVNASNTAASAIYQATSDAISAGNGRHTLWVQQDFLGTTGTPVAIRGTMFLPHNTSSSGAAAVAGYSYLGWTNTNLTGSGTESIGVHGEADVFNGQAGFQNTGVGLNAEGSYTPLGTDPGPQPIIIGVVSNIGTANTAAATMIGVEVYSNPNPGAGANSEGGIRISAQTNGTHQYGLKILDNGGQYLQPLIISSAQGNSPAVNIVNTNSTTGTTQSFINFYRGDTSAVHNIAAISAYNLSGSYGDGFIRMYTNNGGVQYVAVTVDNNQVVTVAKNILTTPVHVAQLPPAAANVGSWASVNDATVTTIGTIVVGGGTNTVGLFCTPAGWKIVMS